MSILDLQAKHIGETLFIIGSGPTLGEYDTDILNKLGERACIGVNRTQYLVSITYFISSYLSENLLAKEVNPDLYTIHTRAGADASLVDGLNVLKRVYSENVSDLRAEFDPENPYLITRNNVLFLAINMALVMGAKRIVCVGCEQKSGLHFYNLNDVLLEKIVTDMAKVISKYSNLLGKDHPYERPLNILRSLTIDPELLKNRPFYAVDHGPLLGEWIGHIRSNFGVEVYSCAAESVLIDAGAQYISLEEAINI
jgi:hypothetical protein